MHYLTGSDTGGILGQLVVTPVASKINNMNENKSVVDGISPKMLTETVEQTSTPLAHVFKIVTAGGSCTFIME